VSKDEQIQILMDRLIEQDKTSRNGVRELDMCRQQLNHAKSAVQGLTLENEKLEKELRFHRQTRTPEKSQKLKGRKQSFKLTSGPVSTSALDVRRASDPAGTPSQSFQPLPTPTRQTLRRRSSADATIAEVVQEEKLCSALDVRRASDPAGTPSQSFQPLPTPTRQTLRRRSSADATIAEVVQEEKL
jgi:hypothetical protein